MNNPNVKFGKPVLSEFPDSFSSPDRTNRAVRLSHFGSEEGSSAFSSFVISNASVLPPLVDNLPFKRYVDSVGDPVRRSMLLAQVQLETGKHPSTVDRYLYGVTRPDGQNRRAIAFVVGKFTGCTLSGDELFPATYPYSGRIRRSSARTTLHRNKPETGCRPGASRPSESCGGVGVYPELHSGSPLEIRLSSRAKPLYESRPACGSPASFVC